MAQINLLKQNTPNTNFAGSLPKICARVFMLVLVVLVGYYIWLIIDSNNLDNRIVQAQAQLETDKQTAATLPQRNELLTRQLQVKNLSQLISGHLYWSQLFLPLANATLHNTSYTSLRAVSDGELQLSATVPDLQSLDKYMQVFDLPQFNKNFSNIRIDGFSKDQNKNGTNIKFQVKMQYDPSLIKYNPTSNGN